MAEVITAEEIARRLGGTLEGDGEVVLEDVRSLRDAEPRHLSFLTNRRYARQLSETRAGAVLLDRRTELLGRTAIRCDDPYLAFARALEIFHPAVAPEPGVDERAFVGEGAAVDGARIDAFAWVGPGARVGPGSWVEAGAYVGADAQVGSMCHLMANSVVCAGCRLGDRIRLNPGAVVGGEGFGFVPQATGHVKIPQVGIAVVEDDVEVGSNTCIDRATLGQTWVRRGAKLDNLVQVGHNAEIGEGSFLVSFSGVAGSSRLGRGVILAARAGVAGHLEIGDGVQVGPDGGVLQDQPAGARVSGIPAIEHSQWLKASVVFPQLPTLLKRLRALEARVAELEEDSDG